ncbi:MAG: class II fructose-bisphosphate aldolase, partial [Methylobacteriaceae bacterium]|nr:class II fructose-bisphosphate aldolase [Methylobacteriaceae bacterium]
RLIRYGAQKINIGTALRMAFGNTLRRVMSEHPGEFDRVKLFKEPMQAVKAAAIHKIRTLLKGHEPVEG